MAGLKDQVVLITGSSNGIGAAAAELFSKHGSKVIITGRNKSALDAVEKRCKDNGAAGVAVVEADLSTEEGLQKLVKESLEAFGTLNVLVNNAGAFAPNDLEGLKGARGSPETLDFSYNILLRVPWRLSGYFLDELIKNKGTIINISSEVSMTPVPSLSAYGMIKAALNHMTKIMAVELGMQGIRVNAVIPGNTVTNISSVIGIQGDEAVAEFFQPIANKTNVLEQKLLKPMDVAKSIVFLASDDASRVTGIVMPVDGGFLVSSAAYDFAGTEVMPGLDLPQKEK